MRSHEQLVLDRIRAVVEAAGIDPRKPLPALLLDYLRLGRRTQRVITVVHRPDGEIEALEARCLEPHGPIENARRHGLVMEIGNGKCCVLYPGEELVEALKPLIRAEAAPLP